MAGCSSSSPPSVPYSPVFVAWRMRRRASAAECAEQGTFVAVQQTTRRGRHSVIPGRSRRTCNCQFDFERPRRYATQRGARNRPLADPAQHRKTIMLAARPSHRTPSETRVTASLPVLGVPPLLVLLLVLACGGAAGRSGALADAGATLVGLGVGVLLAKPPDRHPGPGLAGPWGRGRGSASCVALAVARTRGAGLPRRRERPCDPQAAGSCDSQLEIVERTPHGPSPPWSRSRPALGSARIGSGRGLTPTAVRVLGAAAAVYGVLLCDRPVLNSGRSRWDRPARRTIPSLGRRSALAVARLPIAVLMVQWRTAGFGARRAGRAREHRWAGRYGAGTRWAAGKPGAAEPSDRSRAGARHRTLAAAPGRPPAVARACDAAGSPEMPRPAGPHFFGSYRTTGGTLFPDRRDHAGAIASNPPGGLGPLRDIGGRLAGVAPGWKSPSAPGLRPVGRELRRSRRARSNPASREPFSVLGL